MIYTPHRIAPDPGVDLDRYAEWLAANDMAPKTIAQRREFARRRLEEWGTLDVPGHVVVPWLQQYSGYTRNTYLGHFRSLYAWMVETGHVAADPTAKARRAPRPKLNPNPIPTPQLEAALATADPRLRAWIALGALAGMRCHEIAKVHDRDVTERHITVDGKWGVVAILPTHPLLWDIAQDMPRDDWWFPSPHNARDHVCSSLVGNLIRAHFRSVGITSGSVHRLRHTYCTNLGRAGVRPRVQQILMRHASLETTMGYDMVDDDELHDGIRRLTLPEAA